eukprot:4155971-Pleurochrysis_carterae.AAC.2
MLLAGSACGPCHAQREVRFGGGASSSLTVLIFFIQVELDLRRELPRRHVECWLCVFIAPGGVFWHLAVTSIQFPCRLIETSDRLAASESRVRTAEASAVAANARAQHAEQAARRHARSHAPAAKTLVPPSAKVVSRNRRRDVKAKVVQGTSLPRLFP